MELVILTYFPSGFSYDIFLNKKSMDLGIQSIGKL